MFLPILLPILLLTTTHIVARLIVLIITLTFGYLAPKKLKVRLLLAPALHAPKEIIILIAVVVAAAILLVLVAQDAAAQPQLRLGHLVLERPLGLADQLL